jgi:membrane-associated protease RseP (regulator of RpoE activity)
MSTRQRRPASPAPRRGWSAALALSLALHAGVFAALAVHLGGPAPAPSSRGVLVRLILPPGRLVPAPEGDGPLPPRTVVSAGSRVHPTGCGGTVYTGIGATVNRSGFIIELAPDGPAQRADLRPGDAILNLEDLPINTYPAGHPVSLRLLRDGAEMAATVRIGAICDEPEAPIA